MIEVLPAIRRLTAMKKHIYVINFSGGSGQNKKLYQFGSVKDIALYIKFCPICGAVVTDHAQGHVFIIPCLVLKTKKSYFTTPIRR